MGSPGLALASKTWPFWETPAVGVMASLFQPCGEMRTDGEIEAQGSGHLLKACGWRMEERGFKPMSCGSAGKESACNAGDLDREDPLEKRLATHSSLLAWRIPWTV